MRELTAKRIDAVIFETKHAYVQFAGELDDMRCEAIGDLNLEEPLTDPQLDLLARLRFYPPDADSAGNHWQHLHGAPEECLVWLAMTTLKKVYGARADEVTVQLV